MEDIDYQIYKPAKTINEQIIYLKNKKRIRFNEISEKEAYDILLKNNYINVITPFKHKFAKLNEHYEVIKKDGNHIYERDVEFKEYYDLFLEEREKYPLIINNILAFEIQFKSITSYYILTTYNINNSTDLKEFMDKLKLSFAFSNSTYSSKRINHMNNHLDELKSQIFNYADIYCFLIE